MHLVGIVLTVLGAWVLLAVPAALVVGRFMRVGSERSRGTPAAGVSHDSLGSRVA